MGKLSFSQKRVIIYLTCDDVFRESKIFKNNGRNGLLGVFLGISPLKKKQTPNLTTCHTLIILRLKFDHP